MEKTVSHLGYARGREIYMSNSCPVIPRCPFRVNKFHYDSVCCAPTYSKYCPYYEDVIKDKLPREWAGEKVQFT